MSSFECTKSVFNITKENNSFSIIKPGQYQNKSDEKTIDELKILLELKSLELNVKKVRKGGKKIKLGDNENKLSDFDIQKMRYLKN